MSFVVGANLYWPLSSSASETIGWSARLEMYAPSLGAATTTAVLRSVALAEATAFGPGRLLKL
jgi:hypothetical protein